MKNYLRSVSRLAAVLLISMGLFLMPGNLMLGQISVKHVNSIIVDNDNVKWFTTDVGIVSFDGTSWTMHKDNKSWPDKNLKSLAYLFGSDASELWIASPDGATVTRISSGNQVDVVTYNLENAAIPSQNVLGIAAGKDSIRWIGTDKGIAALKNDQWLTPDYGMYYPESMFKDYPITSMATNPKGDTLYIGTAGVGVARVYRDNLDGISGASVYAQWGPIVLPSDSIRSIYIAPDGTKWFGTEGGVARHVGNSTLDNWTAFTTDDGLVDNFVQAITGDPQGHIWFGTKAGISVFSGSSWTSYTTENGLASNNILSLAADKNGIVWIGTDVGITSYENETFINY